MKHLTMLGLAALAALALTAVAGAGTASAKVCSNAGKGAACAAGHGNEYKDTIKGMTTASEFKSMAINVKCDSEIFDLITNSSTGAGSLNGLEFKNCVNEGRACTAGWLAGPYPSAMASGTLTFSPTVDFSCKNPKNLFETMYCKYAGVNVNAIVTESPTAPYLKFVGSKLTRQAGSNLNCSAEMFWHGEYSVVLPTSLWLT